MGEVVHLGRRDADKIVWTCRCGCMTHYLRADDVVECAQCERVQTYASGEWRLNLPAVPLEVPETEDGQFKVTDLNHSGAAMRRTLDRANADDTAFVVILQKDGRVSCWGSIETKEQSDWFDRQVADAKRMLAKE